MIDNIYMSVEKLITNLEEKFWGGATWATKEMTLKQRALFFRDTGLWPGQYEKVTTESFMQADIDSARQMGQEFCAKQKLKRAHEAGLKVK